MESAAWKRVKKLIDKKRLSVCAWCRRPYTESGIAGVPLTDQEYAEVVSHGICQTCKLEQLEEARGRKAAR